MTRSPPAAVKKPTIARRASATSAVVTLSGVPIGTGASPCWTGNTITVFGASVPLGVVSGGAGLYEVRFPTGASGDASGGVPWFGSQVLPLMEGASPVLVGKGSSTIAFYDAVAAGTTFSGSLSYSLRLPVAYAGSILDITNIDADGLHGLTCVALPSNSTEVITINGTAIAATKSSYRDGDWNGSVARPLPELWDNTNHDIRFAVSAGSSVLNVGITAPGDCLTPVANVIRSK